MLKLLLIAAAVTIKSPSEFRPKVDPVVTDVDLSGIVTEETDPTVPAWAKEPTPPRSTDEAEVRRIAFDVVGESQKNFTNTINNICVSSTNSPDGTFEDCRVQIGENAQAIGVTDGGRNQSIAIGLNSKASGMTAIAIGSGGRDEMEGEANGAKAAGGSSVAIGYDTYAGTQSVAIGPQAEAQKGTSVAIGLRANTAEGYSVAIGKDATTISGYSIAIGNGATANANPCVQIGAGENTRKNSLKVFNDYMATETFVSDALTGYVPIKSISITIGSGATGASQAVTIGQNAKAEGSASVAIGLRASSKKGYSVALGKDAVNSNSYAIAIGNGATTDAQNAIQIGAGYNNRSKSLKVYDKYVATENFVDENYQQKGNYLTAETDPTVPAWAKNPTPPVTEETDPTVPAWAKAENPPAETDPTVPEWAKTNEPPIWTEVDPTVPEWAKAENPPAETDPTVPEWAKTNAPPIWTEVDPTVPEWAKNPTPPVTEETDPTVPEWAKAENPPAETDPTVPEWAKNPTPPVTQETDPTVPEWAKNPNPPVTEESDPIFSEFASNTYVSVGGGSKAKHVDSIAIGHNAEVSGVLGTNGQYTLSSPYGIAIGSGSTTIGTNSISLGSNASASESFGIAIGHGSKATKRYSIAIGEAAKSDTALKGIAIGATSKTESQEAIAIGPGATVNRYSTKSIAIGSGAKVNVNRTGANVAVQIGTGTNPDEGTIQFLDKKLATENYVDTIVASWEQFLDGSNVVFSITNYISGTYDLSSAKFRILELRQGETNYTEVYNSRDEILLHIADYNTKTVQPQIVELRGEFESGLSEKADKAWGKYTSSGGVAPSNQVYMTAPHTVFAGGMEYERVAVGEGAICVLTTKGAPVYTQGDEGSFKFQDANGTNYFGFAKTDSYVIGAETDGISVSSGIVTLEYNVTMSGVPCIWYCPSLDTLPISWEMLNTSDGSHVPGASHVVQWDEDPPVGKRVCYINCPEPEGFFRATIEEPGEAKFMTNMPADLSGGIICTNEATGVNGVIRPIFDGSSVRWEWSMK